MKKLSCSIDYTGLRKNPPITSKFSEILWWMSQNQQNKLFIGCVYVFNQQIQWFAYVKCFSRITFHPYVHFKALDTFLHKKEASKEVCYHVKGCF